MKFKEGQTVYLNDKRDMKHGSAGTVVSVGQNRHKSHPYQVQLEGDDFALFYSEEMLSDTPIKQQSATPIKQQPTTPYDFDRTGLGIGGLSRHSLADEMQELIARGEMKLVEREKRGPLPNGELWEPCEKWGCDNEPVCVNCFYCERHCTC